MILVRIERSLRALSNLYTFDGIRHQMNRKRPSSKFPFPFPGQIFPFPFPTLEMEMDLEMEMVGNSKYFHFLWSKLSFTRKCAHVRPPYLPLENVHIPATLVAVVSKFLWHTWLGQYQVALAVFFLLVFCSFFKGRSGNARADPIMQGPIR